MKGIFEACQSITIDYKEVRIVIELTQMSPHNETIFVYSTYDILCHCNVFLVTFYMNNFTNIAIPMSFSDHPNAIY
jgi:hypothetical protein